MSDQATQLRNLVLRAARQTAAASGPEPRLVLLTGGKGGVGTTTLALNFSVALAQNGSRVVLVDADLNRADVSVLCGLEENGNISDVLSSRRNLHEVLQRGPAGVLVVPGSWDGVAESEYSIKALNRLSNQLRSLGRHADIVILDVGAGSSRLARSFWQTADQAVLVTTPDSVSVMDSYATIKKHLAEGTPISIDLLVNRVADVAVADDVWERVDQSCRRFLKHEIGSLGCVISDESVSSAAARGVPFVIQTPSCKAAQQVQQLSAKLLVEKKQLSPLASKLAS